LLEQTDELRYEFRIGLVEENGLLGCHESNAILASENVTRTIIVVFAAEIAAVRRKFTKQSNRPTIWKFLRPSSNGTLLEHSEAVWPLLSEGVFDGRISVPMKPAYQLAG
jgi:hypothetical protein